jgi:hypothetical protein
MKAWGVYPEGELRIRSHSLYYDNNAGAEDPGNGDDDDSHGDSDDTYHETRSTGEGEEQERPAPQVKGTRKRNITANGNEDKNESAKMEAIIEFVMGNWTRLTPKEAAHRIQLMKESEREEKERKRIQVQDWLVDCNTFEDR